MNLLTLLVGQPGMGKTTSMRHLGSDTVIFNTERKELPFRSKGAINMPINTSNELLGYWGADGQALPVLDVNNQPVYQLNTDKTPKLDQHNQPIPERHYGWLHRAATNPNIKNIIIDSFSDYTEMLDIECIQETSHLSDKEKSFRRWDLYNYRIKELFDRLKLIQNKYIFLTGHPELVMADEGYSIIRMSVKGKQWEGKVEKTATCVFFAEAKKKTDGTVGVDYRFVTNTDSRLPAKTPMEMFPDLYIENDLVKIIQRYDEYYGIIPSSTGEQKAA